MIDNSYPFCLDDKRDRRFAGISVIGDHTLTAQALDGSNNPIGPLQAAMFSVVGAVRRSRRGVSSDLSMSQGSISNGLVKSNFEGASGTVLFRPERKLERDPIGLMVGLYNIHPKPSTMQTSKNYYTTVLLSEYTQKDGWKDVPGAVQLNRDGSVYSPTTSRRYFDSNYLSQGVRVVGLILLSIAWLLAFGLWALIIWMRNEPEIAYANPQFLQLLCLGSAVLSTTILTLSWDENTGWTEDQLNLFCTLSPWFFFSGHTVHIGAMFMVAWHWNAYNTNRTSASFSPWRVLVPLFLFLSIMVALLIAHTIMDPWMWQRVLIRDIPAETYGQCSSNDTWAYFGPMVGLVFFMEFLMMFFAWKNPSDPDVFFDHGALMYTCFARLQAWLVGGSILAVLGDSSVDATYFGRILLIWIFSMSCLLGLVGPKVFQVLWIRCHPDLYDKRYTGRVNIANIMKFRN
jgi:hypothetical protein